MQKETHRNSDAVPYGCLEATSRKRTMTYTDNSRPLYRWVRDSQGNWRLVPV